jgi:DNA replication protein DnaC
MRHDPAGASIVIMLRSLTLYGMAQAVEDLVAQGAPAFEAASRRRRACSTTPMLSQLLKAEMAEREVRSIAYHTKVAHFPSYKDLAGFDFKASEINQATVRQLHRGEFMDNAENVVLIGGPGTGKSHIATAIGVQPSNITGAKCDSTRPWNSSTRWNRKKPSEKPGKWPRCSPSLTW